MGTTTKLTFEEFRNLPEREGTHCELDEGELLMEASPAARHNLVRQRIAMSLTQFIEPGQLGIVLEETDFRLGKETVRNPDVAFVTADHAKKIDIDLSPIEGPPALAVEVISPSNTAQDISKKTQQYLQAGSQCVWLVYPALRLVEIHTTAGVRRLREPEPLLEEALLPGFSVSLQYIFDGQR
jgi:Uma2 family endonuclease